MCTRYTAGTLGPWVLTLANSKRTLQKCEQNTSNRARSKDKRPRLQETGRETPIKAAFVRLKCKGWLPRGQPLGWFKNKPWFGGHVRNEFDLNRSFKTTHSSESNQKRKRETRTSYSQPSPSRRSAPPISVTTQLDCQLAPNSSASPAMASRTGGN